MNFLKLTLNRVISVQILFFMLTNLYGQGQKFTRTNLHLRSGPGVGYQIISTIPGGTSVAMEEDCNCEWIKIKFNGKIGFVKSDFLSKGNFSGQRRYYTNVDGEQIQSPTSYNSIPEGATALCRDGTYSFSRSRRGTCSHHGGVARWLR